MRDGVVGDFTVAENLLLIDSSRAPYSRFGFLRDGAIRRHCEELVERVRRQDAAPRHARAQPFGRQHPEADPRARALRKPARAARGAADRGVDVGAAAYIHDRLVEAATAGTAILVISEDLDEVLSISDRILVMYEGAIIAEADPRARPVRRSGLMMAGVDSRRAEREPPLEPERESGSTERDRGIRRRPSV